MELKTRLRIAAVVLMTAAVVKIAWMASPAPTPSRSAAAPLPPSAPPPATPNHADSADTSQALNRLRDAFFSFSESDQMEIVREMNAKHAAGSNVCSLAWNDDGTPFLSLDRRGPLPPSMAAALNRCAGELEKRRLAKTPVN